MSTGSLESKSYVCGYCGNPLASNEGYYARYVSGAAVTTPNASQIYVCHYCKNPTYFEAGGAQVPGSAFGGIVAHVPEEVASLYEEARDCMKVSAHTAAVMCCRKLMMNIAVARGAETNKSFAYYVDYLSANSYLPPGGKEWVDLIRTKGNEANHEIALMGREDAEELITFSEMLLKFVYEYPAMMKARADKAKGQSSAQPGGVGNTGRRAD